MEHGTHCHLARCNRLTFLPIRCSLCAQEHCEAHVQPDAHDCPAAKGAMEAEGKKVEGPNRAPCAFRGCSKKTLHVVPSSAAGGGGSAVGSGKATASTTSSRAQGSFTHAAPRCPRCKLTFCSSHASPTSHACAAPAPPTEGDIKRQAAEERKRKAAETMAKFRAAQARAGK